MNYEGHIKIKPLDQIALNDFAPGETGVVNFWVPRYRDIQIMSTAIKEVSGKQKPLVLDVNCGSGLVGRLISDTGLYVIGIDNNAEFIRQASKTYGNENTRFVHGDVRNLPEIVRAHGIEEIDGIYCSFMPEEVDSVSIIKRLKPKVTVYVLEGNVNSDANSLAHVLNASKGYEVSALSALVSYRDLHYLASLNPEIQSTGFVIQARRDITKPDILRSVIRQKLSQHDAPQQKYAWEAELDQKLAEARKSCQESKR